MNLGIGGRVEAIDRHRVIGVLTVLGLLAGAAIAVFGLPPLQIHSPLRVFGWVCPFCGATRAVQALLRGDLHTAWMYNPIAFLVVPAGLAVVARGVAGLVTGRWWNVRITRPRLVFTAAGIAFVALWINQAQHAAMIKMGDGDLPSELLGTGTAMVLGGAISMVYLSVLTRRLKRTTAAAPSRPADQPAENA